MLIPKGNDSFEAELFVMISDYAGDRIDQHVVDHPGDAVSYCGLKNKLYPDRRSMGYPFDRQPRDDVDTLQDFLTPNMSVRNVIIQFKDITLAPGESFPDSLK
uniref:Phenoloxidase 1-like n=1 Tax=Diabrotica virgifera virgifera TaxID=50390 RepID=A0A6P7FFD8_DIAVI